MRSTVKPDKRDAILNAMLDVVVERGMIYHHFASKEEIIQALYERVRALKRASLLDGYYPDMDAKAAFIRVAKQPRKVAPGIFATRGGELWEAIKAID